MKERYRIVDHVTFVSECLGVPSIASSSLCTVRSSSGSRIALCFNNEQDYYIKQNLI